MDIKIVNISDLYGLDGNATLKCFLHKSSGEMERYNQNLPALIIAPGGGYGFVSEREGDPIAVDFFNRHYNAFVLTYTVAPEGRYPLSLTQYASAVDYVRSHAEELCVNPDKITVMGFSAGGHLTANLCNFWWRLPIPEAGGKVLDAKPNSAVLSYPVIAPYSHHGSFHNLLGIDDIDCDEARALDLEKSVTDKNPPTFVWTTMEDRAVNPLTSMRYTEELMKRGVQCELHMYAHGWHGLSTFDERTNVMPVDGEDNGIWLDQAYTFLKNIDKKSVVK